MSIALGCIADDYTGATDLANTLTRNGLRTLQLQGLPGREFALDEIDAVVLALKTRSIDPAAAVAESLAAYEWLNAAGAGHVMLKICSTFDSTERGNIGPVIDALRSAAGAGVVPVCPAFPETGRTVYAGHLFVDNVLLSESPLRDHPINPMRDANLVRVLARQSREPVGLADFAHVEGGSEALRAHIAGLRGVGSIIVDAVCERHLETLGEVAGAGPLSTGASGLGLGLARALRRDRGPTCARAAARKSSGSCAMIAGSCSRATLEQIEQARARFPVFSIDPKEAIEDRDAAPSRAVAWARPFHAQGGSFLVASSAAPDEVRAIQQRFGAERVAAAVEAVLAEIAERLFTLGVRRFIIAGGETSGAIVERLGVDAFLIGGEVAAGVPVVHAHETDEPMSFVLKSGNFGAASFFADALQAMDDE